MTSRAKQQKATFKHRGISVATGVGAWLRNQPEDIKRVAAMAIAGKPLEEIATVMKVSLDDITNVTGKILERMGVDSFESPLFTTREARRALQRYMPEPELPY